MRNDAVPVLSLHRAGDGSVVFGSAGSDAPLRVKYGSLGLGAAPVSFASSPRLAGHGSVLRGRRLDEREIFLPVQVHGVSMSAANRARDDLMRVLSPLDPAELTLRVQVPGRDRWREIPVHYAGGLEGDYDTSYHGNWQDIGLELKATEALWRGEPETVSQSVDPGSKPFLSATEPFFPVLLADSSVAGQITVNVAGDAPTAPVWTVTPPGEDLLIRNLDTGEQFYMDGVLTETIRLDMANGRLTSASAPNGELWDRVSVDSRLFQLRPGRNQVEFSFVGATADSKVHVSYSPRYLAGY